jgi:hypothetical protein
VLAEPLNYPIFLIDPGLLFIYLQLEPFVPKPQHGISRALSLHSPYQTQPVPFSQRGFASPLVTLDCLDIVGGLYLVVSDSHH